MARFALWGAVILGTVAVSPNALALESSEFHLYGINKAGIAFDVTLDGKDWQNIVGDPETKRGIRGEFVSWVKPNEPSVLKPRRVCTAFTLGPGSQCTEWEWQHRAGRCRVWLAPSYKVTCAPGTLPLSGVTYTGEKLEESDLSRDPDAEALYKSFLRRYDGARPGLAAVYRCKEGCKDSVPPALIFLWLGD